MSIEVERGLGLEREGIETDRVKWNLSYAALYEEAVRRQEGVVAAHGPLACRTGQHTGRSPNDKFVVRESSSEANVAWGKVNQPMDEAQWDTLHHDFLASLKGKELYVLDAFAGADAQYRLPIRVITEYAWHNLFCRNLFIVDPSGAPSHAPQFTVIDSPSFKADPARHGTRSESVIAVNFAKKLVLIGSTSYAGEMKKSIFSVLNYILPLQGVLPMHCSANVGGAGDVALFFGLSGTGKTTLSSDPHRGLIGDDEHGWSDRGVFNFEGGCYAKTIKLSAEAEPQIYATTRRFGTVLENVVVDPETRALDLDDDRYTENTRAAYPIDFIDNAVLSGLGGHPRNVVMLTADAFGVLPPISRLTPDGAMYHFLSGYTAKVAGTEKGTHRIQADLQYLLWRAVPAARARLLRANARREDCAAPVTRLAREYRMDGRTVRHGQPHEDRVHPRDDQRGVVRRARCGDLREGRRLQPGRPDLVSGRARRRCCNPRNTWANPADYDAQAAKLAKMFVENFKAFEGDVSAAVKAAGPSV